MSVGYSIARIYVDFATRISYRRIRIIGKENIPADAPVIFASNHATAMMDPLVLLLLRKGRVHFGCRADIFKKPTANKILRFLGILPLARERDGASAVLGNLQVFEEIIDGMGQGVPFCLYPQGTHFPDREHHPLKKGVVRIASQAFEKLQTPVYIVPVGLVYETFFDFMGALDIKVGEPIKIDSVVEDARGVLAELDERLMALMAYTPEEFKKSFWKYALAVLSLPIFAVCAIVASPILIASYLILRGMKDKAWSNTIRYSCSLIFFLHWPFHRVFYLLLNFYKKLI